MFWRPMHCELWSGISVELYWMKTMANLSPFQVWNCQNFRLPPAAKWGLSPPLRNPPREKFFRLKARRKKFIFWTRGIKTNASSTVKSYWSSSNLEKQLVADVDSYIYIYTLWVKARQMFGHRSGKVSQSNDYYSMYQWYVFFSKDAFVLRWIK